MNSTTIRENIAFDIDRLIYSSECVEDLLNKLKERGYEVKHGKYIAVKAPNAERFVRLKSLGEDYLPKQLEKRIAERDKFANILPDTPPELHYSTKRQKAKTYKN